MNDIKEQRTMRMGVRIIYYFLGMLIMALGIGISVKSDLGVSPVSSIPYMMTCVWGIEMGRATIIFHVALVLLQLIILRKNFRLKNFLQVPVGFIFGYLTTLSNYIMSFFPSPSSFGIRLAMMLVSAVLIAAGVFLYVPTDLIPLAGEGFMIAVSETAGFQFSNVKLAFDSSMVIVSLIVCLICIHSMGSVGIGTIIAAVLVGLIVKFFTKCFGKFTDKMLYVNAEAHA